MTIKESDLCALELCALDRKTRLLAVTHRTSPRTQAVTYVQVPFIRKETEKDRSSAAIFQALNEKVTWSHLQTHPGAENALLEQVSHIADPRVARAMRATYRGQPSDYVCIWCPAKSVSQGWAHVQLGVDPQAAASTANQMLILDVYTGMQVWSGYENPHGKRILAMLRKKHPDACQELPFGLVDPEDKPVLSSTVLSSTILDPLRESLRECLQETTP